MDNTAESSYPVYGGDNLRETLYIGVFNNTHFQSLLKDEPEEEPSDTEEEDIPCSLDLSNNEINSSDESDKNMALSEESEKQMDISQESEDDMDVSQPEDDDKCPCCKKKLKNVLLHIRKSVKCRSSVPDHELRKLEEKSKTIRKQKKLALKSQKRLEQRMKNPEKEKEKARNQKDRSRNKLRNENYDEVKAKDREHKSSSRKSQDPQAMKENQMESMFVARLRNINTVHTKFMNRA